MPLHSNATDGFYVSRTCSKRCWCYMEIEDCCIEIAVFNFMLIFSNYKHHMHAEIGLPLQCSGPFIFLLLTFFSMGEGGQFRQIQRLFTFLHLHKPLVVHPLACGGSPLRPLPSLLGHFRLGHYMLNLSPTMNHPTFCAQFNIPIFCYI